MNQLETSSKLHETLKLLAIEKARLYTQLRSLIRHSSCPTEKLDSVQSD